jgi:anti-anti-sigma regulatory factor
MITADPITETDLYHIFAVECRGDTLVVTPRGDAAGFPPHQFRAAVARLQTRCCGRPLRNLIIDLSGSDYPGLSMLGAFRDLIASVRGRGGTAAVAGASPDTLRVLAEYNMDREWTIYDDMPEAVRAVVHESIPQRMHRKRRPLLQALAAVGALLLIGAVYVAFDHRPAADTFRQTEILWKDYRRLEALSLDEPDWRQQAGELAERSDQLAKKLLKEPGIREVTLAVHELQAMLHAPQRPETRAAEFEQQLAVARDKVRNSDWRHRALRSMASLGSGGPHPASQADAAGTLGR